MFLEGMFLEEMTIGLQGNLEFILRILLACFCGGMIGYERTRRRKEAGIRTHVIVAIGAALLMIVSKYGFYDVVSTPGMRVDASRIASNVITGVSFLGAGVIFVKTGSIKGLTTAAGLWATAGIGLALGAGMYFVGVFATIFITLMQILLHSKLNQQDDFFYDTFSVIYESMPQDLTPLKNQLARQGIAIEHISLERHEDGTTTVLLEVQGKANVTCSDLSVLLTQDPTVRGFKL